MMRHDTKRRKARDGIARARILLRKNLPWLPSFPMDETGYIWRAFPWESPGRVSSHRVTRNAVRQMEMALMKLRHHFPRALPKVVEDAEEWLDRMDFVLRLVKGAVHGGASLDVDTWLADAPFRSRWRRRFLSVRDRWPALGRCLDAVGFLEVTKRGLPNTDAVDWIDDHADGLSQVAERTGWDAALSLCALRRDADPRWLELAFDLLSDESVGTALSGPDGYFRSLEGAVQEAAKQHEFVVPKRPNCETVRQIYLKHVEWLLSQKPKQRRSGTVLLATLAPDEIAETAGRIEQRTKALEKTLAKCNPRCKAARYSPSRRRKLKALLARGDLDTGLRDLQEFSAAITSLAQITADGPLASDLIKLLSQIAKHDRALPLRLFTIWHQNDTLHPRNRPEEVFRELHRIIAQKELSSTLLRHWRGVANSSRKAPHEFASGLVLRRKDRRSRLRSLRLLERTLGEENLELTDDQIESVSEFVEGATNVVRGAKMHAYQSPDSLFLASLSIDSYFMKYEVRAAMAIGSGGPEDANILKVIGEESDLDDYLSSLGEHVADERVRQVIRRCAVARKKTLLRRMAALVEALHATNAALPRLTEFEPGSDWPERYPQILQEPLEALSRATPDARRIATRLLRPHLPDPGDLRQEASCVEEKLKGSPRQAISGRQRLARRLENLLARLRRPTPLSEARLNRLSEKLWARVDHLLATQFIEACREALSKRLQDSWGLRDEADALVRPPFDRLTEAILGLRGATRDLGIRVLVERTKSAGGGFRHEPPNVAFLEAIARSGIDIGPWLDPRFQTDAADADGKPYAVAFTRDALDVLLMGKHFGTCLAPDDFNFFLTLSNVVDVNKQVAYGRAADGRVIGRCLFALCDDGRILTYHRYAHQSADRFGEAVDKFAMQLARTMNTTLARNGNVSTLVATQWYDDGPVRPPGFPDIHATDGEIRTLLRSGETDTMIGRLIDLFGDATSLRDSLGELLWLDEFNDRRTVVEPFAVHYGLDQSVPFTRRMRLAVLSHQAGLGDLAHDIIASFGVSAVVKRLARGRCCECHTYRAIGPTSALYALLTAYNPSASLRLLRQTRSRGIRRDKDETDSDRRLALANAHKRLGRTRLASELQASA